MVDFGSEIRTRRAAFALSVETIAKMARIAESRLEAIEAGEPPSTREVAAIAEALASDPARLAKGGEEDPRWSVARFRSGNGATKLDGIDLRLLAKGAEAGRILASLKKLLGEKASKIPDLRHICATSPSMEPWRHGYMLGEKARLALSSDKAPEEAPIPSVQALLESLGVHVAAVDFLDLSIEAASIYELDAAPVVLVNRRTPRFDYLPRRALLAHELCHILHDGGKRDLTTVTKEADNSPIEQRANGFAPSFLAPAQWVDLTKTKKDSPESIVQCLAETWGLSFEGAAWHAKNINLLDPKKAEQLANIHKRVRSSAFEEDIPRTPPEQFDIEQTPGPLASGLLAEIATIACAEGLISRARAAEIMSLR